MKSIIAIALALACFSAHADELDDARADCETARNGNIHVPLYPLAYAYCSGIEYAWQKRAISAQEDQQNADPKIAAGKALADKLGIVH